MSESQVVVRDGLAVPFFTDKQFSDRLSFRQRLLALIPLITSNLPRISAAPEPAQQRQAPRAASPRCSNLHRRPASESIASSTYFPARPLFWRSVQKPWIPRQRNNDRAPICKIHSQRILCAMDVSHSFSGIRVGSAHTISPIINRDSQSPTHGFTGAKPRFPTSATGSNQNFAD